MSDGTLENCPVVSNDVSNATTIFGPNLPRMRGASTRKKPNKTNVEFTKIPREFYLQLKFVTLTADVMFLNGIAFLITFSQNIKLLTVEHAPNRTVRQLAKSIMKTVKLYAKGGFPG